MSKFQYGEWESKVENQIGTGSVKVWLYRRIAEDRIEIAHFTKDGFVEVTEVNYAAAEAEIPPTMILPFMSYDALVGALQQMKPVRAKEVVDAELAATKYHLEDMRKLVFEPNVEVTHEPSN